MLNMNGDRSLSKHYTDLTDAQLIKARLKKYIPKSNGLTILDPCCGAGDLLKPYLNSGNKLIGADINPEKISENLLIIKGNSLTDLRRYEKKVDVIVTNPPFGRAGHPLIQKSAQENMSYHLQKLEMSLGITLTKRINNMELSFLSLSLNLLNDKGVGAIILPESVFCGDAYYEFRKAFQAQFNVLEVFELNPNAFQKSSASVRTGVLVFSKNVKDKKNKINSETHDGQVFSIESAKTWYPWKNISDIKTPLRFQYFEWSNLETAFPHLEVKSGYKGKQPKELSSTTKKSDKKFSRYITSKELSNYKVDYQNASLIETTPEVERVTLLKNDILLVRSGSGCIGRIAVWDQENAVKMIPRSEIYILRGLRNKFEIDLILTSFKIASLGTGRPWWLSSLSNGLGTPNMNKTSIFNIPILDISTQEELKEIKKIYKKLENSNQLDLFANINEEAA